MSIWERLEKIDVRIIYWVILVVLAFPLIRPIGIPISTAESTRVVFEEIDNLRTGDVVLIDIAFTAGTSPEVISSFEVISKHLFEKGVRVIYHSFMEQGPMFAEAIINGPIGVGYGLEYGVDVVNLGFTPGVEPGQRAFGDDIRSTKPRDFSGAPIAQLPIMDGIMNAGDFALVVSFHTNSPGMEGLVRQWQSVHGTRMVGMAGAASVGGLMPFVNSGQIVGLMQGLRSGAEYEVLARLPGTGVAQMDAQSLGHIAVIVFIALGNIGYFIQKKQAKK